jgi:hypothetical protein
MPDRGVTSDFSRRIEALWITGAAAGVRCTAMPVGLKRRDVFFVANLAADHRSGNLALILNA